MEKRTIKEIRGMRTRDGAGVSLVRVIGHGDVLEADPFLLLDAFDSVNPDDYIRGFPMHPHRGIETITYLIEGRIDHKDSLGNSGSIRSGQAQWMTAGRGILHEEMPQPSERMWGLQIWLNLAKADKMTEPKYFDITEDMVGVARLPEGTVRVISGEFAGARGVHPRHIEAMVLDVDLNPNAAMRFPFPHGHTAIAYTLTGGGAFGEDERAVDARTALIFGEGDSLTVRSGPEGLRFMLLGGAPLREPIAWGGPIVMNTQAELRTAFEELERGTFIR